MIRKTIKKLLSLSLVELLVGCGHPHYGDGHSTFSPSQSRTIVILLDATKSWQYWLAAIEKLEKFSLTELGSTDTFLALVLITNRNFRVPAPFAEDVPRSTDSDQIQIDFLRARNNFRSLLKELKENPPNFPPGTDLIGALYEAQEIISAHENPEVWLIIFSDLEDTVNQKIQLNLAQANVRCFYPQPGGDIEGFKRKVQSWTLRFREWNAQSVKIYDPSASQITDLLQ